MAPKGVSEARYPSHGMRPFYEELRDRDASNDETGDEEDFHHKLNDIDLEQAEALIGEESRATLGSNNLSVQEVASQIVPSTTKIAPARIMAPADPARRWAQHSDDVDDDVPASLLVEPHAEVENSNKSTTPYRKLPTKRRPGPLLSPSAVTHDGARSDGTRGRVDRHPQPITSGAVVGNARDKAMWQWANTSNLDRFVLDVYNYYEGCGMWCILVDRILRLGETTFVAVLLTWLTQCVDYNRLHHSQSLTEVVIPQCTTLMPAIWSLGVWLYAFYFIWKCVQFIVDIRRLSLIRNFFTHLLNIPEQDMQTVSWQDVIVRIMSLRDANAITAINVSPSVRKYIGSQSKERLDAHDIANRLMRQDNYLVAMINKDVFDLTLPLPLLRNRQFFSKTLEWCLQFTILDLVFNDAGQVRQEFLKSTHRGVLSQKLRQRLVFAGVLNLVLAPFVLAYIMIRHIFIYYQEYQKNPGVLGARSYTALAEWKFREFNELPHMFRERINMSYPFATRYVTQFPKQMTEQVARTVAFVTGALAAVLAALSVQDSEFLNFEITTGRSALFYFTILGAIWAFARNSISEETAVFNPEYTLNNVIDYTHYMPNHWRGRLHSTEVLKEFSELYKLKWVVVLEELLGIFTAPLLLLLSLPKDSDRIIDFFREFTIHVDGLGYVCSFAVFDFKKGAKDEVEQASADVRENYYATKHGKMAASFYGFIDNYVINPKTGIPGHMPPIPRQQFHPPPSFPPAPDAQGLRFEREPSAGKEAQMKAQYQTGRPRSSMTHTSPLASILLDPHHQLSTASVGAWSLHRPRQGKGIHFGEASIVEESSDRARETERRKHLDGDDLSEGGGDIFGESTWETSPAKNLKRENNGAANDVHSEPGVLDLIYQLQRTKRPRRSNRLV